MNSAQMFSEEELAQLWNQQADEFNQWDSLSREEQLEWAQARALQSAEPAPLADEGLAKLVSEVEDLADQHDQGTPEERLLERVATMLRQQQARIIELEKRLEGVKPVPVSERLRRCPTHGQQPANSWGCPECVRELREQLAAQALQPVPVGERLPGPEDCDAEGRCWLFGKVEGDWRLLDPRNSGVPKLKYCFSHWLPAHCLPIPQEES